MRHGKFKAVLAMLMLLGCTPSKPLKDMVGYVPPSSLPAPPKRTLVGDGKDMVWSHLVDFLKSSSFEIDRADDRDKNFVIARYSGDPEPYVDCGSIVTHQGGSLDQIAGSAQTVALNYELEEKPVILNRALNLDSRIIIRLTDQSPGTVVSTDTTYVVTKTVDVADADGGLRKGSRETINFSAGGRGEFSKGTACQPNGFLDVAVLKSLPNVIGSDEIDRDELPKDSASPATPTEAEPADEDAFAALSQLEDQIEPTKSETLDDDQKEIAAPDIDQLDAAAAPSAIVDPSTETEDGDWVLPERGLPTAALPGPSVPAIDAKSESKTATAIKTPEAEPSAAVTPLDEERLPNTPSNDAETNTSAISVPDDPSSISDGGVKEASDTIVETTTRELLKTLDCDGDEWHFCELIELTVPYRRRNIEKLFGLTVNTIESFTSQSIGNDMKLDLLFPSFPSYLHIAYARRDGTIDHVLSSQEVWPADLTYQLKEEGRTIPGPAGLAMIVAIATDEPLFPSSPSSVESAETYLARLKQRLEDLDVDGPDGPIAASQLLIYVENAAS